MYNFVIKDKSCFILVEASKSVRSIFFILSTTYLLFFAEHKRLLLEAIERQFFESEFKDPFNSDKK